MQELIGYPDSFLINGTVLYTNLKRSVYIFALLKL